MKLKFKNQDFQTAAVETVCDLFSGQEKKQSTFSVTQEAQTGLLQNEYGVGNALLIDDGLLLANMNTIQKKNNLPLTDLSDLTREVCLDGTYRLDGHVDLSGQKRSAPQFCIEMETGTGKTYVYTKTIFELHKRYGFCKFIIVVPSVAIREGVYKSLQITAEHFGNHYDNVPCRYFIYNSAKLSDVRQFATSSRTAWAAKRPCGLFRIAGHRHRGRASERG